MTEMAALMQGTPGPPGRGRPGRPGSPGPQGRPGILRVKLINSLRFFYARHDILIALESNCYYLGFFY